MKYIVNSRRLLVYFWHFSQENFHRKSFSRVSLSYFSYCYFTWIDNGATCFFFVFFFTNWHFWTKIINSAISDTKYMLGNGNNRKVTIRYQPNPLYISCSEHGIDSKEAICYKLFENLNILKRSVVLLNPVLSHNLENFNRTFYLP